MKVLMKIIILSMVTVSMVSMLVLSGCKEEAVEPIDESVEEAAEEEEVAEEAAEEAAEEEVAEEAGEPIRFGNLAVHTGPFGHYGDMFDGGLFFPLRFIEEIPPLGRPIQIISEDAGTVGHGTVSRQLVEQNKVHILYNIEAEYPTYSEFLLENIAEEGIPLLPSIHGGAIEATRGGTGEEPLFRGMPMDDDIALVNSLHLQEMGATKIVVMAVVREEMQRQQEVAARACEYLGMEVLDGDMDLVPESPSYAAEAAKVAAMDPDGVLIFAAGEDAGTIVKNLSEAGVSAMIMGETNMTAVEFLSTATLEAIQQQIFVKCGTFGIAESPATDFFFAQWENPDNADLLEMVDNQTTSAYVTAPYDLMNCTFLAIELAGGEINSQTWVDAMYEVTMSPGKKVYTYAEGIEALRAGEDIDYDGVTGSMDYSPTGVLGGTYQIQDWSSGELIDDTIIDSPRVLELSAALFN